MNPSLTSHRRVGTFRYSYISHRLGCNLPINQITKKKKKTYHHITGNFVGSTRVEGKPMSNKNKINHVLYSVYNTNQNVSTCTVLGLVK